jgi:hypothetical protein
MGAELERVLEPYKIFLGRKIKPIKTAYPDKEMKFPMCKLQCFYPACRFQIKCFVAGRLLPLESNQYLVLVMTNEPGHLEHICREDINGAELKQLHYLSLFSCSFTTDMKIATTTKSIFMDIYEGKEKKPKPVSSYYG